MVTNLTFLNEFTRGDVSKVKKYIQMYLDMAAQKLQVIEEGMQKKDYESIKVAAHTLKSQTKYMGISVAEETIIRIERYCGEQTQLHELPALVEELTKIVLQSMDELKGVLPTL